MRTKTIARLVILFAVGAALAAEPASIAWADELSFLEVSPVFSGGNPAKALHDAYVFCEMLNWGYPPGGLVQSLTAVGGWPPDAAQLLATAAVGHLCPAYKAALAQYFISAPSAGA